MDDIAKRNRERRNQKRTAESDEREAARRRKEEHERKQRARGEQVAAELGGRAAGWSVALVGYGLATRPVVLYVPEDDRRSTHLAILTGQSGFVGDKRPPAIMVEAEPVLGRYEAKIGPDRSGGYYTGHGATPTRALMQAVEALERDCVSLAGLRRLANGGLAGVSLKIDGEV